MREKIKLSGVPETMPQTMAVREKLLPESGAISQVAMSAMDNWATGSRSGMSPCWSSSRASPCICRRRMCGASSG